MPDDDIAHWRVMVAFLILGFVLGALLWGLLALAATA